MGASKGLATIIVFAFSAIFHEVVISTPFRHYAMYAFFGMLAQAPLTFLTKFIDQMFDNAFVGNAIFWCVFCVVGKSFSTLHMHHAIVSIDIFS
jgi:diacylglycerol O-acyltransferase-1